MNERQIRIAFAQRQFEIYKMRVLLAQAENNVRVMKNYIENMTECNETIDRLLHEELNGKASDQPPPRPLPPKDVSVKR